MQRTSRYTIWPRDMSFVDGLHALIQFSSERKFVIPQRETSCKCTISISNFDELSFHKFDEFIKMMERTPAYEEFSCLFFLYRDEDPKDLSIQISVGKGPISVRVTSEDIDLVEATHRFLQNTFRLQNPVDPGFADNRAKYLQPTIFIAHSFDPIGEKYFTILSKFLRLLGLDVKHGLDFRSQDIPQKVRALIDSQDILLAVISGNKEAPWLTAEPSYAMGHGKHIVLAVEKGVFYNPTILGKDLEQIRFEPGHIEQSFIPLLSEFRSIRVKGL